MDRYKTSLLTIVSGRQTAFQNFLKGLTYSTVFPDELIIIFMNEPACNLPDLGFPVKSFEFYSSNALPLAVARNKAAQEASGDLLIFLDIDCIVHPELISAYQSCHAPNHLLVGPVRYLPNQAPQQNDFFTRLLELSSPDPIRATVDPLPYELFWSLNFACEQKAYELIGGFDEGFNGYGGEDTDFAFSARAQGIPIKTVDALAFHQYHRSYSPPLNHFSDIVLNAQYFYSKWSIWPMDGWLSSFEQMGLISWTESKIRVIRQPNASEVDLVLKS